MRIEVWEQPRTKRIGLTLDSDEGKRQILFTPQDFETLVRKVNSRPRRGPTKVDKFERKIAIDMVWRGDTYGLSWKLRKAIVKIAMPDLARTLDRKV